MAVKVGILEQNGEEYEVPYEHRLIAEDVYEDDNYTETVNNLLYSHPHTIVADKEVVIPENYQLINEDGLTIYGQLTIEGSLVL